MRFSKQSKYLPFALGFSVPLTVFFFQNATQVSCSSGSVEQRVTCAIRQGHKDAGKPLVGQKVVKQAVDHLGFGMSPYDSSISMMRITNANAPQLIGRQIQGEFARLTKNQDNGIVKTAINTHLPMAKMSQSQVATLVSGVMTVRAANKNNANEYQRLSNLITFLRQEATDTHIQSKLIRSGFGSMYKEAGVTYDSQLNLSEVLSEFWFNHFNVDLSKVRQYALNYDEVIQTKMITTFKDLVLGILRTPSMLVYLDNQRNVATNGAGSNQNLARELLELHTIGLPPGVSFSAGNQKQMKYTQADVAETAKLLTGWGLGANGTYAFSKPKHVAAGGSVMGTRYTQEGEKKLEALIADITKLYRVKYNICRKLSWHLAGNPVYRANADFDLIISNAKIISSCVSAWGSNGNLMAMYKAILSHPDFWNPYRAGTTVKSPLEIVVSAYRMTGANTAQVIQSGKTRATLTLAKRDLASTGAAVSPGPMSYGSSFMREMRNYIVQLGLPYRMVIPPTGYTGQRNSWLNSSYLLTSARVTDSILGHGPYLRSVLPGKVGSKAHLDFNNYVSRNSDSDIRAYFANHYLNIGLGTLSENFRIRYLSRNFLTRNADTIEGSVRNSYLRTAVSSYFTSQEFILK